MTYSENTEGFQDVALAGPNLYCPLQDVVDMVINDDEQYVTVRPRTRFNSTCLGLPRARQLVDAAMMKNP